ncbi:restriction endonuclease [Dyella sp.]|uniref:restriction endonuclease n=1 Tax=Dyella sp. TaxID=1869338 RepID=UPI002B46A6AE|nr:restriction endonuclease [Dyella sp.]HKT26798.1 restriction endonuclease [Dyella sp.]
MSRHKAVRDARSFTLQQWIALVITPEHERKFQFQDYEFPTDEHRDEFLEIIHAYPEKVVKSILRSFLVSGGSLGADESLRRGLKSLPTEKLESLIERKEFVRRLMDLPYRPWDGITWVLDLLPNYPAKVMDALDAYFTAHAAFLPDGRLNGLSDAEAIIRKRYLNRENPRDTILELRPSEFEHLIGALYEKLGYEVSVTQATRDGGVDVEARQNKVASQALVLVQCKRYEGAVPVSAVRELMGVVSRRHANKGVLIATGGFTRSAQHEASMTSMIELIDYMSLNQLLNKHFGAEWPNRIGHAIRDMQRNSARNSTAVSGTMIDLFQECVEDG